MAVAPTTKTMKFNIGGAKDKVAGSKGYIGPTPPADAYLVRVKRLTIVNNNNGDPMVKGVAEIAEPDGTEKAKYNGFGIWFQQNITDQGAGYVNQLLEAMGGDEVTGRNLIDSFWDDGIKVQADPKNADVMHIRRIGTFKVNSPDGTVMMIVQTKFVPKKGKWDEKLDITSYVSADYERPDGGYNDEDIDDDLVEAIEAEDGDEDEAPVKKAPAKKAAARKRPQPKPEPEEDPDEEDEADGSTDGETEDADDADDGLLTDDDLLGDDDED